MTVLGRFQKMELGHCLPDRVSPTAPSNIRECAQTWVRIGAGVGRQADLTLGFGGQLVRLTFERRIPGKQAQRPDFDPLQSFDQALLTTERRPLLGLAGWPRYADLPLTYHPVPDIT